jgi:hypothetical protein
MPPRRFELWELSAWWHRNCAAFSWISEQSTAFPTPSPFLFFPPTNSFLLFLPSNPPPFHLHIFFLDSIIESHFYQQNRYALFSENKKKKKNTVNTS